MLFNSFEFALFLSVVFIAYWFVIQRNLTLQNLFVVLASYTFYGWWDWRFLSLIALSTVIDYGVGLGIANSTNTRKKLYFVVSIITNLGLLGVFKYYNFFINNFNEAVSIVVS